jgi:hypothetical protein
MVEWHERLAAQEQEQAGMIAGRGARMAGRDARDESMEDMEDMPEDNMTIIDEEEFPIELTDEQRQAFADWLSQRVDAILAHATGLREEDRSLLREYLAATELEDIVSEWLDAYSDPDNLADLAAQLRSEETEEA